mgnify:CR=1 FL=1
MASVNLNISGGSGPYTIVIRENSESSGNRYISGTSPATFTAIPDNANHTYKVSVDNGTCTGGTTTFGPLKCPCVEPIYTATADCSNVSAPKLNVTSITNPNGGNLVVSIYNGASLVTSETVASGSNKSYSVTNGNTYTVKVKDATYSTCQTVDVDVVVNCSCTLSVTASSPSC